MCYNTRDPCTCECKPVAGTSSKNKHELSKSREYKVAICAFSTLSDDRFELLIVWHKYLYKATQPCGLGLVLGTFASRAQRLTTCSMLHVVSLARPLVNSLRRACSLGNGSAGATALVLKLPTMQLYFKISS